MFMLRCATTCPTRRPFCFLILSTPSQRDVLKTLWKKTHILKWHWKKSCDIQESLLIFFVQPQIQGLGIPKNPCLLHAFHTHIQHSTGRTPRSKLESPHPFLGHWATNFFRCPVSVFFASTICVDTQYTVRFLVLIQIHICHIFGTIFPYPYYSISFHIHIF